MQDHCGPQRPAVKVVGEGQTMKTIAKCQSMSGHHSFTCAKSAEGPVADGQVGRLLHLQCNLCGAIIKIRSSWFNPKGED